MRVLGVDPGLLNTGYGIIEPAAVLTGTGINNALRSKLKVLEAGVIRTNPRDALGRRVNKIYSAMRELVLEYRPEVIVLEELFSLYKNPRTAILMAHARGTIVLLAAQENIPLVGYAAKKIKKAIIGTGLARKEQMQAMVKDILGLKEIPKPHDVADALSLAIAHINLSKRIG